MKYICLDPGLKHTGIAISAEGVVATPLSTIEAADLPTLINLASTLINQFVPDLIIIGQPVSGALNKFASNIKLELESIYSIPVTLYPEDMTSMIAATLLVESGIRKSRRQSQSHQSAAAVILQDYLDSQPQTTLV